jgi:hypothetical protein
MASYHTPTCDNRHIYYNNLSNITIRFYGLLLLLLLHISKICETLIYDFVAARLFVHKVPNLMSAGVEILWIRVYAKLEASS